MNEISLYLITGFLGSGKTTLLKRLLNRFKNKKLAVIINEFGPTSVDGAVLDSKGFTLSEVNDGSIFCTCKSDAFIDAILHLCSLDVEIIFIETSGISNPESMPSIMPIIKKNNDRVFYKGCITVASAHNITKLLEATLFARGQIKHANILILNKIDLVSPEDISTCIKQIREYNTKCKIYKTSYCEIPNVDEFLDIHPLSNGVFSTSDMYTSPMVNKYMLKIDKPVSKSTLLNFLNFFKKDIFRVKGFVTLEDQNYYHVDGTTDSVTIKPLSTKKSDNFIIFIYPDNKPMRHLIKKTWETLS